MDLTGFVHTPLARRMKLGINLALIVQIMLGRGLAVAAVVPRARTVIKIVK